MERITSRQNPIVRRFRALVDSPDEYVLLDGAHLLEEALASGLSIDVVAMRDALADGPVGELARRAEREGARVLGVTDSVLAAISPVRQPSGVVAIARRREAAPEEALGQAPQLVLMLDDIQDPGNVGAIIRAADACGATGVIASQRTADPFGWKALRGSMGSTFRVPVAARQSLADATRAAQTLGLHVYAAVPREGTLLPECDLRRPVAVLLGGEGPGLSGDLVERADELLTIPMRHPVASMNVATAAAIVVYEARRQRRGDGA